MRAAVLTAGSGWFLDAPPLPPNSARSKESRRAANKEAPAGAPARTACDVPGLTVLSEDWRGDNTR